MYYSNNGQRVENRSYEPPVMNHQFKVTGGWVRYCYLAFLLIHSLLFTPVQMLLMLLLEIPPKNTLTGVICLGLLMESLAMIGYIIYIATSRSITVSGRQLGVRRILKRTAYDCTDIVNISCEITRTTKGQNYVIKLTFRDQTEYRVILFPGNKFKEFAIYLLQMLDAGVIAQHVINPEHRGRLQLFAQGKGWRR